VPRGQRDGSLLSYSHLSFLDRSSPSRVKNFRLSISSSPALGPTQPPIKVVTAALSPEVKRQGREADHSLPSIAEVKKM
jgi:hypothetical protein